MSVDAKIPRLVILLTLLITSACISQAAANPSAYLVCAASYPNSCTAPVGISAQKMPPVSVVNRGPVLGPGSGSERLVPMTCEKPGPIRAIAFYTVGLIKSTVAVPFRLLETVIPLSKNSDCEPVRRVGSRPFACQPQPGFPMCRPAMSGCSPASPQLAPLPGFSNQPQCSAFLPPHVVKEYEFPPTESDNLLTGLWNLPATLLRQGRITGDIFRNNLSPMESNKR